MTLEEISLMFNRALGFSFSRRKWLLVTFLLALCGIFVVFLRGVGLDTETWVGQSLVFLPIFLSSAVLLACGILLIRLYHDEVKKRDVPLGQLIQNSWVEILGGLSLSLPIILGYLLLWIFLGFFVLASEVPALGPFFSTVLVFGPFLLCFGSVALIILNLLLLFLLTPTLALKGFNKLLLSQMLARRLGFGLFQNLVFLVLALVPLFVVLLLLLVSIYLTGFYAVPETKMQTILLWFFVMIPFTFILSPAIIFFFNFSAEAHVWIQKKLKTST